LKTNIVSFKNRLKTRVALIELLDLSGIAVGNVGVPTCWCCDAFNQTWYYFRKHNYAAHGYSTAVPIQKSTAKTGSGLNNRIPAKEMRKAWGDSSNPAFDVGKMKYLLDHDNHEMRDTFREFLKKPLFQPRYEIREFSKFRIKNCRSLKSHRMQTMECSSAEHPRGAVRQVAMIKHSIGVQVEGQC
jgi:hypothetical protein